MRLTKQGVRDLDDPRQKRVKAEVPQDCDHRRMNECCSGCGHLYCPDCGLSWDTYSEH